MLTKSLLALLTVGNAVYAVAKCRKLDETIATTDGYQDNVSKISASALDMRAEQVKEINDMFGAINKDYNTQEEINQFIDLVEGVDLVKKHGYAKGVEMYKEHVDHMNAVREFRAQENEGE